MFTETRPGVARSPDGFEVADLGIFTLVYREGDHVMRFDKEVGMERARYYIRDVPHWDPPHEDEVITADHAATIQHRIVAALAFRKYPFDTNLQDDMKT